MYIFADFFLQRLENISTYNREVNYEKCLLVRVFNIGVTQSNENIWSEERYPSFNFIRNKGKIHTFLVASFQEDATKNT